MSAPWSWRNFLRPSADGKIPADAFGAEDLGMPSSGGRAAPQAPSGGQNGYQLEPDSRARNMAEGMPYQLVPAYPPFVRLANNPNILYFPRFRTITFGGNGVAAATTTQTIQFSLPTIVMARTGSAFLASDAALPVGRTALQTFALQFVRAGAMNDMVDTGAGNSAPAFNAIAENLLGPASLPAFFPGTGLFFDTGSFLNVTCQILLASIRADITIWCLEEYGPGR